MKRRVLRRGDCLGTEAAASRRQVDRTQHMPAAIETEGLTKDFLVGFWRPRPYRALDALTLQVEPGEVFGFLGPNGAGKSTTLKLLMQLIYPTSGSAKILGRPVGDLEVRRRIGFLAENPYYYDYLTAEEVLAYFARLFGYSRRRRAHRASRACSMKSGMAGAAADAAAPVVEGPVAARRARAGADQRSRGDLPRRADVRPRSARPAPGPRFDPQAARSAAAPCSSARTSCRTPKRCAAGSASWRKAGMVASGRVSDLVAFELKGWELVVADLSDDAARALAGRGAHRHADRARTFHAGSAAGCGTRAPDWRAARRRRHAGVAESGARNARRLLRSAGERGERSGRRSDADHLL